ncbi:MAG: SDR family oxidoreductase [Prosthecochloris sp.]|nr:SDR family oxidoreductase [Prosthecochloris sp.]
MDFTGTVLVAGATGRTGKQVVHRLQHYGIDYRVFVRSGEKAVELFGPEVADRLTLGSVLSDEEVAMAVRNADAVICAIGGNVMDPDAPPPSAIDRDGIIRLARHAKARGVKQFILISSMAVTKPDHPLNKYGRVLSMKLESENEVRRLFSEDGFSYTILRPGGLIEGEPLQHRLLFDTGDRLETGRISRSDVAEAAVEALWEPFARKLTFELVQASEDEEPQASFSDQYRQIFGA